MLKNGQKCAFTHVKSWVLIFCGGRDVNMVSSTAVTQSKMRFYCKLSYLGVVEGPSEEWDLLWCCCFWCCWCQCYKHSYFCFTSILAVVSYFPSFFSYFLLRTYLNCTAFYCYGQKPLWNNFTNVYNIDTKYDSSELDSRSKLMLWRKQVFDTLGTSFVLFSFLTPAPWRLPQQPLWRILRSTWGRNIF